MWHINKTRPPKEFVEYCKTPGASYKGLSGESKRKLRKRLVEDQGYICCYCGMEISDDEHTKIEHVKCQKYHSDLALCFDNMLASCFAIEQCLYAIQKDKENELALAAS